MAIYTTNMDKNKGIKFVDEHNIFTNNAIDTLQVHSNLLMSKEDFDKALAKIYFKEEKKRLVGPQTRGGNEYTYAKVLFRTYIHSLVGFWVGFRDVVPDVYTTTCVECIIIEDETKI